MARKLFHCDVKRILNLKSRRYSMSIPVLLCLIIFTLTIWPQGSLSSSCPPWMHASGDDGCECGSSLGKVVQCDNATGKVSILTCNCMTYSSSNHIGVGRCLAMCRFDQNFVCTLYNSLVKKNASLNEINCGILNRTGQLCGSCLEGFSRPVFSYSLACIHCNSSSIGRNFLKYVVTAFVPITVLYVIIMEFKIYVTKGSMVCYVLICQIYTTPIIMEAVLKPDNHASWTTFVTISLFSFWNLDFFRSLYSPFCLHPEITSLQVISLDYFLAVYPMLLIVLTYIGVSLHDRYSIGCTHNFYLNYLWKNVQRRVSIRDSLIPTFVTFIVLSYVKVLNTSFTLLLPVPVYNRSGKFSTFLYVDGEIPYFGKKHLPYAMLAVVMMLCFNVLPIVLLVVYPCTCFQAHCRNQGTRTFVDAIQGCYKTHPRDCRYYSAIHFLFRIVYLVFIGRFTNYMIFPIGGLMFLSLATAAIVTKPYKVALYNKVEFGMCLTSGLLFLFGSTTYFFKVYKPRYDHLGGLMITITVCFFLIQLLYGIGSILSFVLPRKAKQCCSPCKL